MEGSTISGPEAQLSSALAAKLTIYSAYFWLLTLYTPDVYAK